MSGSGSNRSAAYAALAIVLGFGLVLLGLPKLVLWIGGYSPVLAAAVGTVGIMSFFIVLWLRARYQRRRDQQ
ncbi:MULTISPECIES: hypothetical protein [Alphaproteobacteria]|uniref:Uncharacterized protein n=2 Tax=Alphaproteobacteria TaxID=28211 RepID=A0A512HJ09_9HYPH|nr:MULTISPECIES: hypothetical protein [Alphaproteobacteria]GEO85424.1 hypothetical protein RNA01_23560 [Ciceribacter naphthalenivorans]GLR21554.1 hypothetical protein GCM10007920_13400 [Ciceribacter naphthalenivorans]GLT04410.1 hypothetical protein GCM10007926_13400 [Sphingomonas psychrolutea]